MSDMQLLQTGLARHQAGDLAGAAAIYEQLIQKQSNNYYALHFLGVVRATEGKFAEAARLMEASLRIEPWNAEFAENYATALMKLERYADALAICERILSQQPANPMALYVSGSALAKLKRGAEAMPRLEKLLALAPNDPNVLNDLAVILADSGRASDALKHLDRLLQRDPHNSAALLNKANILAKDHRLDEAAELYRALIPRSPPHAADALLGLGNVRYEGGHIQEALDVYDRALNLNVNIARAWLGRANALETLQRYREAVEAYGMAIKLDPQLKYAEGARLYSKLRICGWTGFAEDSSRIIEGVRAAQPVIMPFALFALPATADDQLQCAKNYVAADIGLEAARPSAARNHTPIRIGYLSADFRQHPVSQVMAGVFERHDKTQFETFAFSAGHDDGSELRARIVRAFDHFLDVRSLSDRDLAALIRQHEIDIVIDLTGFTKGGRTSALAARPAPVQTSYLGYPGTTGAGFIDYIVADETLIPAGFEKYFSEKIARLPGSFFPGDEQQAITANIPSRIEAGLPEHGFVFCCFNQCYKILPDVFDCWLRLLTAVEGSVLWLSSMNLDAQAALRRVAEAHGILPERIVFAESVARMEDHLARHRLADLFLDTRPYGAHTTAMDALSTGLPVLTCISDTFASRVAASMLAAANLPELITQSLEDYEALALKLAREPEQLRALKDRLAANRQQLFDTARFTRKLEIAYREMHQRAQNGLPPESFSVEKSA